jgi:uncharacterized protein YbjT (DUF2867 family)
MKIVVIGGTGMLGSMVVTEINRLGHEVIAASPNTGVDTISGDGLSEALTGAEVVVDASNSPVWEDAAVLDFFQTSSGNLTSVAAQCGVNHYVAMSIVGADRLPDSGYLRAKVAQESVVRDGGVPFTIVRATQFFEFIERIADSAAGDSGIELPSAPFQPAAVGELGALVAKVAQGEPINGIVEIAGPQPLSMGDAVAKVLRSKGDTRPVLTSPEATYFGTRLETGSLLPGDAADLTSTTLEDWLGQGRTETGS